MIFSPKISFGINITNKQKNKLVLLVSEVDQFHDRRKRRKEKRALVN
jgi:hypothetical protein